MNKSEFSDNIALSAIVVGKVIAAIGQTPLQGIDSQTQGDLLLWGSLIQINGNILNAEFLRGSEQLGVDLQTLGYVLFVLGFILYRDDLEKRIRLGIAINLDLVLAGLIILSDKNMWRKMYLIIGNMMIIIGNFLQALGRKQRISQRGIIYRYNPMETRGAWTQVGGAGLILLGRLWETAG